MKFLWAEKMTAVEIQCRLEQAFQKDADRLSSVYGGSELSRQDAQVC
jgi:hypothetical protein